MFFIALTFPISPSEESIDAYNIWFELLFELLPIDADFENVMTTKQRLETRDAFLDFVIYMHKQVLDETLEKDAICEFFEYLRATDCQSTHTVAGTKREGSCRRPSQKIESVCVVLCTPADETKTKTPSFMMDPIFLSTGSAKEETSKVAARALTNEQAFCSCLFSVKWFLLHLVASRFPTSPKLLLSMRKKYETWLLLFEKTMSCFACRVNFKENMTAIDYQFAKDLQSRDSFMKLIFNLHANINTMLGKANSVAFVQSAHFFDALATKTTNNHSCNVMVGQLKEFDSRFYLAL
jgi:hypothetical protein